MEDEMNYSVVIIILVLDEQMPVIRTTDTINTIAINVM